MKYLLLIPLLFLTGCFPSTNCPPLDYSPFKYGDRVVITEGFYKDQVGSVRAQRVMYNFDTCNEAGIEVKLDNGGEEVTVLKSKLSKHSVVVKCKPTGVHPFCKLPR